MTRILALGHGPLPFENTLQGHAPGKRTWQLVSPLLQQGHDVCLICSRIPGVYPDSIAPITKQQKDNLLYYSLNIEQFHQRSQLEQISQSFQPDCVVGITTMPASIAAELNLPLPLWADLYGSIMAEAQVKAQVYQSDTYLRHFLDLEYPVLARADVFSSVSDRQRYALIGELGLCGRLNLMTAGEELVYSIPAGGETAPYAHSRSVIRGSLVSEADFVVLYSGGYNTWTDVDTLFSGVEQAMKANPRIHFVSTGGVIYGHDEETYPHFEQLIAQSPFRDRFHLCGWVDWKDVHNYYLESDVGILSDKVCYEALLGSRTRVLDWMRAELPTVTTPLSEVTAHLVDASAGFGYPAGDADALGRLLVSLAANAETCKQAGQRARSLLQTTYSFDATTSPLQAWAQKPTFASDYKQQKSVLMVPYASSAEFSSGSSLTQTPIEDVGWFNVIQPVWQKMIHHLYRSRWAFLVPALRKVSAFVLRFRSSLYSVRLDAPIIPEQMVAGQIYQVDVSMTNTGRSHWLTDKQSRRPVNLSYHWRKPDQTIYQKEGVRTALPREIGTGEKITLCAKIIAPNEPGRYVLDLDLVREQVGWFSDLGANHYLTPVTVVSK